MFHNVIYYEQSKEEIVTSFLHLCENHVLVPPLEQSAKFTKSMFLDEKEQNSNTSLLHHINPN